jgi:hypothetical protein
MERALVVLLLLIANALVNASKITHSRAISPAANIAQASSSAVAAR